jgi:hypothetical protein
LNLIFLRTPAVSGTQDLGKREGPSPYSKVIWLSTGYAANEGRIDIDGLSETGLHGGVIADFGDGRINGSFGPMTFCGSVWKWK